MNETPEPARGNTRPQQHPEIIVLVCNHFIREAQAAVTELGLQDVCCKTFSSRCGRPPLTWPELEAAAGAGDQMARTVVLGGCCLSQLECEAPESEQFSVLQTSQCFELIVGKTFAENQIKQGGFLTTPGWLACWRPWMDKSGFDRRTAREFFRESINGIVLLDTGTDDTACQNLEDFAAFVERPAKVMLVGIDVFKVYLHRRILMERQELSRRRAAAWEHNRRQEQADFAMTLDLLSELHKATSEQEAFDKIRTVFDMLFAPRQIVYAEIEAGNPPRVWPLSLGKNSFEPVPAGRRMTETLQNKRLVRSKDGFTIRMASREHVIRGLEVRAVAFPEYLDRYIQIAQAIADVCGLAIDNARGYEKLKDNENRLREMATTDSLTGVSNRAHFMEKAGQEVQRSMRYGTAFTLIILDVDNFKQINDTYGHPAGDSVLIAIAGLCSRELRSSDFFGRIGGEEFAAGLIETNQAEGLEAAERIRQSVAEHEFEGGTKRIRCTVSIGVAAYTCRSDTLEILLKRGDDALYQAKRQGRNRVVTAGEQQ
ncbi:MAG: diguanylate cyclase [Desulfohalobiaceae bacterium]|nr:diguanylate cyclase [Desulfohalobiaceae bacterium]